MSTFPPQPYPLFSVARYVFLVEFYCQSLPLLISILSKKSSSQLTISERIMRKDIRERGIILDYICMKLLLKCACDSQVRNRNIFGLFDSRIMVLIFVDHQKTNLILH